MTVPACVYDLERQAEALRQAGRSQVQTGDREKIRTYNSARSRNPITDRRELPSPGPPDGEPDPRPAGGAGGRREKLQDLNMHERHCGCRADRGRSSCRSGASTSVDTAWTRI